MIRHSGSLVSAALCLVSLACSGSSDESGTPGDGAAGVGVAAVNPPPKELPEVDTHVVHEFAWVSERISRGGQPVGDAAFKALADAGIKTIINVDGALPDVETAAKYGLRYVHIPFGYDAVPKEKQLELAKTVRELEGPFFVHCHHGVHRGPVGAVMAEMALSDMTPEEAVAELKRARTGEKYTGLWECTREFEEPTAEETAALSFDFPERAEVPDMPASMAILDRAFDRMKEIRRAKWGVPADHPDLSPAHEALQIGENLYETARTDAAKEHGEEFLALFAAAVEAAKNLETALREEPVNAAAAEDAFKRLDQSCAQCHSGYRNTIHR